MEAKRENQVMKALLLGYWQHHLNARHWALLRMRLEGAPAILYSHMDSLIPRRLPLYHTSFVLLLSVLLGYFGLDRFYLKQFGLGVAKLVLCSVGFIGGVTLFKAEFDPFLLGFFPERAAQSLYVHFSFFQESYFAPITRGRRLITLFTCLGTGWVMLDWFLTPKKAKDRNFHTISRILDKIL